MKPLALSDEQMDAILRAAAPLPVADRGPFLEEVAAALQDQPIGDGSVQRVVSEVQRKYFAPASVFERRQAAVQPRTKAR